MDVNCNCFGVASAAKVPVKRYNFLVPDIFPVVEPSFQKPLSASIERKIKKLAEYLERNEYRAPKVSRRLARRLYKDLRHGRYGYVKLAVQAYTHLLKSSKPELSNLFATEIVVRSAEKRKRDWLCHKAALSEAAAGPMGSVVGVLLAHPSVEIKLLGVELLTEFTKLQSSSDYVDQLEGFVSLLCANANPKVPYPAGAGGSAAATKPPQSQDLSALQAACLRALLEHLRYCSRLAYVSHHLDTVTYCVLDNIDYAGAAPGQDLLDAANRAREALQSGISASALRRTSIGLIVGVSPPQVSALLVFEEISHITRDAAEGKKVLEFLMRYLDNGGNSWLGGPVLEAGMGIMRQACAEEHQRYLLYSSLMRHVAAPGLSAEQRAAVLRQAVQDGLLLEQALAAPALLMALKELPPVMHQHAEQGSQAAPSHSTTTFAAALTADGRVHAANGGVASAPTNGASSQQQQQVELVAHRPTPAAPDAPAAAPAGGGSGGGLRAAVLSAVWQLAGCVGEAGPLLEVVASTVSRLAGPRGASSATLECCIAAAEALQGVPEEVRVLPGHTFPQLLLQELMVVMVTWDVPQRLLAHRLLLLLLPAVGDGLRDWQARALLSTIWHEVSLEPNPPTVFVALDACFAGLISSSPAAALALAVQLAASLQAEVATGGGRLAATPAAACCAVLLLCKSMLQQLAATLGHPQLAECAAPGCDEVLSSLGVSPSGLQLGQASGLAPKHGGGVGSSSVDGLEPGVLPMVLPITPASGVVAEGPVAGAAFVAAEEQHAEAFLQGWRAGTSADKELERFREAWAGAPLLRQYGGQGLGAGFQALPVALLAPRMKATGMFGSGLSSQGGSSGSFESKWVQRVRELYRRMPSMRDASVDLQEMLPDGAAARSSADAASPAVLSQQYLDAVRETSLAGKSADEVLAEIDSALAAMELQVAGGRSPEHIRMLTL